MMESEFWKTVTVTMPSHYYEASVTFNGVTYTATSFIHEGEYFVKNKLLCELTASGVVLEDETTIKRSL